MSVQSEIVRISGNVSDALDAIEGKGVTIPTGANSDDLASLINQIPTGGVGAIAVIETADPAGGTVMDITAVDISSDTVDAEHLLSGYTAHDKYGNAIVGTAGASNIVQGTFNLTGSGAISVSLPYAGNGYPIAMIVVASDGINNSSGAWYTNTFDTIGQYAYTKADLSTTPTWGVDDRNKGCVCTVEGNGSNMWNSFGVGGYTLRGGDAKGTFVECVRFISSTVLSVFMKNNGTSDSGFLSGIDYDYWILYSS